MQVFHNYVKRRLRLITIFTLSLAVAFSLSLGIEHNLQGNADELRGYLARINSVVSSLHDYLYIPSPQNRNKVEETLDSLESVLSPKQMNSSLRERIFQMLEDPSIENLDKTVQILGDVAREINGDHYFLKQQIRIIDISFLFALAGILIILFIFAYQIQMKHKSYTERSSFLFAEIGKVLSNEKDEIIFYPHWTEEDMLFDHAKAIVTEHVSNKALAEKSFSGTLESFIPWLKQIIEEWVICDRVAVAFVDRVGNVVAESAVSDLEAVYLEPGYSEEISQTTLGELVSHPKVRIINDLHYHYDNINQSKSTSLILKEGIKSSITLPIEINGNVLGFLFISSAQKNSYTPEQARRVEKTLNLLKQNLLYHYLFQAVVGETTLAFVNLMERKDNETSLHIMRMSRYSYIIARQLVSHGVDISPKRLREILWFSPLHDIGKIGIPDYILLKEGPLTKEEREEMEEHVDIGLEVIRNMNRGINRFLPVDILNVAEDIIANHHEKFDGSGYPNGIAGEDIPLEGRIVAIADVFDALTSKRPYKSALTIEETLTIMEKGVGGHFDPHVYDTFLECLPQIREVYDELKEV